jgi:hypothetical protein
VKLRRLCLALLLFPVVLHAQQPQSDDAESIVTRARGAMDIRSAGSPPFLLTYHVHFSRPKTHESADGEYREVWKSPDQWRREIKFSDFQQIEVGGKEKRWVTTDLASEPSEIRVLREFARIPYLGIDSTTKFSRVKEPPTGEQCLRLVPGHRRVFCFDSRTGVLVSDEIGEVGSGMICYYFDPQSFGGKGFPRKWKCEDDLGLTIDGVVTELREDDAPADPAQFAPMAGATEWPVCEITMPPKVRLSWKYLVPNYMGLARGARVSFTIGVDGKISNIKMVRSLGNFRDSGVISFANRLKFKPATCAGAPIPFTIEATVY